MDIEKLWATDLETHLHRQSKEMASDLDLEATNILAKINKAFRLEAIVSILTALILLFALWVYSEQKTLLLWIALPIFAYILTFYCFVAVAIHRLPVHDPSAPYAEFLTQSISKLKTIKKMYYRLGTLGFPLLMLIGTGTLYLMGHINITRSLPKLIFMTIFFTGINYVVISRAFIFLYDSHIQELNRHLEEWEKFLE